MKSDQPLWMPAGTVRAILALAVVLSGVFQLIDVGALSDQHFALVVGALLAYGLMRMNTPPVQSLPQLPSLFNTPFLDALGDASAKMDAEEDAEEEKSVFPGANDL
jgi:hypothetical protein